MPPMRLIGREELNKFTKKHSDAKSWVGAWVSEVEEAQWGNPQDIKERYRSASLLANNTVIFNVKGNKYRLEVQIGYRTATVIVKWIGTHAEYNKRHR